MRKIVILLWALVGFQTLFAQELRNRFERPDQEAAPWIFWYWMYGAVSKAGITADLEAMKEIGLGGTYLMPIRSHKEKQLIETSVEQLSPEWWDMVRFAISESDRLGLKMGMHICDGFALAGGPWITPELSMQRVVYSDTVIQVTGGKPIALPRPETKEGYYRDIALFALPASGSTDIPSPDVTSSIMTDPAPAYLADRQDGTFRSSDACWFQYDFGKPFTFRSIDIEPGGNNIQALRLLVSGSNDGVRFTPIRQLQPARAGWQNTDAGFTFSIPASTYRYFRFSWTPEGSEPGSEDLDAAKWKPNLKIKSAMLSEQARIDHYQGKSAQVWRLSKRNTGEDISGKDCISRDEIRDISAYHQNGTLALPREWQGKKIRVVRMGHTSTGHTNATGGEGKGLECDKFNRDAVALQLDRWFGEAFRQGGESVSRVLTRMHVDSWECGSQNWSANFPEEFRRRRGYDLSPWLLVYTGIPIESAESSERVLADIRQTIAELVHDVFYQTFAEKGRELGCETSAECVAPTMMSDGLLHYNQVDRPMGEFWLESPTHDKPNDMADAISGAHIYGKKIIQAEGFTQLRTLWKEHPGNLKTLLDANYSLGINKLFFHVYAHNPFTDKKPGMTLDGIGFCMQRDQTWWSQSKAWIDYIKRCQSLLQYGTPVNDIAVFIGEDTPRRAILPDRLTSSLPGLVGKERFKANRDRLRNIGQPMRVMPVGVTHSANLADPQDWYDPLRGYGYDCINPDALLRLAKVENGRMVLPGGASYKVFVLPMAHAMTQNNHCMSLPVARKIKELQDGGVIVLLGEKPREFPGYLQSEADIAEFASLTEAIWGYNEQFILPYESANFDRFGLIKDAMFLDSKNIIAGNITWTHRTGVDGDIYFVSNQQSDTRELTAWLRSKGQVEIWDPVTGLCATPADVSVKEGRTLVPISLKPAQSVFIVLHNTPSQAPAYRNVVRRESLDLDEWSISWRDTGIRERATELKDWSSYENDTIRYFSGTADYETTFRFSGKRKGERVYLDLKNIGVIAEVAVNGIECGVVWTAPFRVDITDAVKKGRNRLSISVTNCWANKLKGVAENRISDPSLWTNAPYRLEHEPLQTSGLLSVPSLEIEK